MRRNKRTSGAPLRARGDAVALESQRDSKGTISGSRTFRSALLAVRLHGDVSVEMIQGAVGFLATMPVAFIHALDLFVASSGALVLLSTGNRNEGVDLRERMLLTISCSLEDGRWKGTRHARLAAAR